MIFKSTLIASDRPNNVRKNACCRDKTVLEKLAVLWQWLVDNINFNINSDIAIITIRQFSNLITIFTVELGNNI